MLLFCKFCSKPCCSAMGGGASRGSFAAAGGPSEAPHVPRVRRDYGTTSAGVDFGLLGGLLRPVRLPLVDPCVVAARSPACASERDGRHCQAKTAHNNSHSTANCSLEVVLGCASLALRGETRVKDISRLRPLAPSMLAAGRTEDGFCQAFLLAERADEFAKAVPDQAQWVTRFAKHFGVVHMHEVMTQVGYDGPGELFSMYLCIFLARPLVERHTPLLTACAQVPGAVSRSRPRCLGVESWQA